MLHADERPTTGYDAALHIRTPSDLLPRLHAVARSRGLTAASFARAAVMEAVARAEHRTAA
jgi:predicted transcriptional regulator